MDDLITHRRPTIEQLFPTLQIEALTSNSNGLMNEVVVNDMQQVLAIHQPQLKEAVK